MTMTTQKDDISASKEYQNLILNITTIIHSSRSAAARSVNRELVRMRIQIGDEILARQQEQGWGKAIVSTIAKDLRVAFPDMKGLSERNLWEMRNVARECKNIPDLQQVVAEIPWGHTLVILQKIKPRDERIFYAQKSAGNGWSRSVLTHQIENGLFQRQGKAITNMQETLPAPQSDLIQGILKDPYIFDFLGLSEEISERKLQRSLVDHLKEFLIELGRGFAFVGEYYPLVVGEQDYELDLLFYHTKQHCYIVIELKIDDFKPEYAGKLNFYLSAVDEQERDPDRDGPTIGILLCKKHNTIVAEYSLRGLTKPMGVSEYYLEGLPTEDELVREVNRAVVELEATITSTGSCSGTLETTPKQDTENK